ncbi:MAG: hypothetical protein C0404_06430 [Verrucomicrobia bacterium]|nr:hypothetical protein [Verrucomicrobiota bacterium]
MGRAASVFPDGRICPQWRSRRPSRAKGNSQQLQDQGSVRPRPAEVAWDVCNRCCVVLLLSAAGSTTIRPCRSTGLEDWNNEMLADNKLWRRCMGSGLDGSSIPPGVGWRFEVRIPFFHRSIIPMRHAVPLLAVLIAGPLAPALAGEPEPAVLARVEVAGPVLSYPLPVHAHLVAGDSRDYMLVFAQPSKLSGARWAYSVLDANPDPGSYVLATAMRRDAVGSVDVRSVLMDDGRRLLVKADDSAAATLAGAGFAIVRLPVEPITWTRAGRDVAGLSTGDGVSIASGPDPLVQELISRLSTNRLMMLMRRLTGQDATVAGGDLYAISTRNTASGVPVGKATQFAFDHARALGHDVKFHAWTSGSYSGRNMVATRWGGAKSNEIVLITAHYDNMPGSGAAPGADDNASGSATVLAAAEVLSQYAFERTIRFVLFTGEEQGLLGSYAYAAAASAAGDNIVAVYNADMLGWDGNGDGKVVMHTRATSNPGYTNDLVVAGAFTNVVAQYGLGSVLHPVITADGESASDHYSFWGRGYAAVLAIEDYPSDFSPYYHQSSDAIPTLNWNYYVSFVRASLGTVAELAHPTCRVPCSVIEVASAPAATGSGIGASEFHARHLAGAQETGDSADAAWSGESPNPNAKWLKLHTTPYGTELAGDSRPTNSDSIFFGMLSAVDTNGTGFSCTNRLRFDLLTPPESNRTYLVRVHLDGRYVATSNDFDCVTNLQALVDSGGWLDLPALATVTNGVVYGTCDIADRLVGVAPSNCVIRIAFMGGTSVVVAASAQIGTRISDVVEVNTNLMSGAGWTMFSAFTNDVPAGAGSFVSGWIDMPRVLDITSITNLPGGYFRIKRTWPGQ